jgi:hypothetical protein
LSIDIFFVVVTNPCCVAYAESILNDLKMFGVGVHFGKQSFFVVFLKLCFCFLIEKQSIVTIVCEFRVGNLSVTPLEAQFPKKDTGHDGEVSSYIQY